MTDLGVYVRLLGRLEVRVGDMSVGPGVSMVKPRMLMASLAANANRTLSKDTLVDRLWDDPPSSARNVVEKYISIWRKALPAQRLETIRTGYRLNLGPDECDLFEAQTLLTEARTAREGGDLQGAASALGAAIGYWDANFEDDAAAQFAQADRQWLSELRLVTLEEWAQVVLQVGKDEPKVIELLVAARARHPLRERLAELVMWALFRQGRQQEAVDCFHRIRQELAEQLGQDPGKALKQMQLRVLRQDVSLLVVRHETGHIDNLGARNARFVGRERQLREIDRLLAEDPPHVVAVWGLVGVGKSALTLEYVHRIRDRYECVWWIDATTRASTAAGLERLGDRLGCPLPADRESSLFKLWSAVRRLSGMLLVYDNARCPDDLSDYLPHGGECSVLISSLNPAWRRLGHAVRLDVLSESDSVALLRNSIGASDTGEERELVDVVGRLPLAMVQAAAYIGQTGMSTKQYLPLFSRRRAQLLERGVPDDHRGTIGATWRLALAELSKTHPAGAQLLALCSLVAPANIPLELVRVAPDLLPSELRSAVEGELGLEDAIGQIRRFSLVTREGDHLHMHCLVQAVIADSLSTDERDEWRRRAADALVALAPCDENVQAAWPQWEVLVPHVREIASACATETASERFIALVQRASRYLMTRAAFSEALELMQRAQCLIEKTVSDPEDVVVGRGLTELAETLEQAGSLKEAWSAYERALVVLRQHAGAEEPWVARALSGLGSVLTCHSGVTLWKPDELQDAERRFVEALEVLETALGPGSPVVARTLSGLGQVRQDRGDLQGGVRCQERALHILQHAYGPDHPEVGHSYDKLAYALALTGDATRSRACFHEARRILESAYGATDPSVAWSLSNLAMLHLSTGEFEQALDCQERADAIFASSQPDGSAREISAWRLARIHASAGHLDEAVGLLRPALTTARAVLGDDHGDVRAMESDLAAAIEARDSLTSRMP